MIPEFLRTFYEKGGRATDGRGNPLTLDDLAGGMAPATVAGASPPAKARRRKEPAGEDPRVTYLKTLTEAGFQKEIIGVARSYGWRIAHFRRVRVQRGEGGPAFWETPVAEDGKGFLDLELVRDRLVKAELKTMTGRLSIEQKVWLAAYRKAGVECYVWKPTDWPQILEVLK